MNKKELWKLRTKTQTLLMSGTDKEFKQGAKLVKKYRKVWKELEEEAKEFYEKKQKPSWLN
jgi:hypothetical protein